MYGTMENVNFNRNCTDNPWNNIYYTHTDYATYQLMKKTCLISLTYLDNIISCGENNELYP